MISGSSVLSALFFYSVMLLTVCVLRRYTEFLKAGGINILLLVSVLAMIRLFVPLEPLAAYEIRSWNILGEILWIFRTYPNVVRFLMIVWAVGFLVVLLGDFRELYAARKQCKKYTPEYSETVQEIARQLSISCEVKVTSDIKIPYVAGIIRPVIYFPHTGFTRKEIKLALSHEAQHIRTHDAAVKFFFGIVSAVMWWNPVAYWYRREIDALLELRCDARVTKGLSAEDREAYLRMLLELARRVAVDKHVPALALDESSAVGKTNVLKQRFDVLINGSKKLSGRINVIVQCIIVVVFCASYLVVFQPAGAPSLEEFQNDSRTYYEEGYDDFENGDGTTDSCIIQGADGRYQLFVNYKFSKYLSEDEVLSDEYQNFQVFEEVLFE